MLFTFAKALESLGPDFAFEIANKTLPPSRLLFADYLPEMNKLTFEVKMGNMTIRPVMAGAVAMDSPYPEGSVISIAKFMEQSAKLALKSVLSEEALREILMLVRELQLNGGNTTEAMATDVLNFLGVILQGHLDRTEWLRAQALVYGSIDWSFNGINLAVDYKIPTANKLATRTTGSNQAYGGSASVFWSDIRALRRLLRYNVQAFIMNTNTLDEIVGNDANSIEILSDVLAPRVRMRRLKTIGGNTVPSSDTRDSVEFIIYDEEGEIMDLTNAGQTVRVPFMPDGKILAIGKNTAPTFRPGQGSQTNPRDKLAIGYTHIAPTVEGGGKPGRWAEVRIPEARKYTIEAEAVANLLPVIENPDKIAIATTEMS